MIPFGLCAVTLLLLLPFALAAPISLGLFSSPGLPSSGVACGANVYTAVEIRAAFYSVGDASAVPSRKRKYPHKYRNKDGVAFSCPASSSTKLYEYPILPTGPYVHLTDPGPDRIVFMDLVSPQFCGVMTHSGAPSGRFILCQG